MERVAVSYLRISQDRRGTELGVDRQRDLCRVAAQQRGLTLARELVDNDVSATRSKLRPAFETLLEGVEDRTIGTIIAVNLDRLLRSSRDRYRLLEACQAHGVSIGLARGTDIDMTSAVGRMVADSLASAARFEVELKSERQQDEREQAANAGWAPPSRRAFGYEPREPIPGARVGKTNRLHEEEAPLVAEAYRQMLAGRSVGSIARWLNGQGATTVSGRQWTHGSVRQMLENPRYKAIRAVRRLKPGRDGQDGKRDQFHSEIGPATWPAIVSVETWDAVSSILRDPARRTNHRVGETGARYLLPFVARCGTCGAHLVTGSRTEVSKATGVRTHARTLRCSTLRHVSRRAEPIEEWVEEVLLGAMETPEARALLRERAAPNSGDVAEIREQLAVQRGIADDLTSAFTEGAMKPQDWRGHLKQVNARIDDLETRFVAAISVDPLLELTSSDDPKALWRTWPIEVKRSLISARLEVVVHQGAAGRPNGRRFNPDSVTVIWLR